MTPASPPAAARVLIIDDHEIVRLGVRHLLGARVQLHEAATLQQAQAMLAETPFDLLLLDLSLGEQFGLAALPRLHEAHPALKIIVLTSLDEELYAERCLRAGASGYVMKSALSAALVEAVEAVLAGQVWLSPRQRDALLRRAVGQSRDASRPVLSAREVEVLRLVAAGQSTREIAEALNRSVKTIETHKQSLKTKLGADTPAMLVRQAVSWFGDGA